MKQIIIFSLLLILILLLEVTLGVKAILIILLAIFSFLAVVYSEVSEVSWKRRADSDEFKEAFEHHSKSGTLKEIEDFTKKIEKTKSPPPEQYKEPKISKKMISEFALFAKRVKLSPSEDTPPQSKQPKKLSDINFQDLDWNDIHIKFQLNADIITKWTGDITIVGLGFDEWAYTMYGEEVRISFEADFMEKNHKGIIKILDKPYMTSCGYKGITSFDELGIIKLDSSEDCYLEVKEDWTEGEEPDFSQSVEQKYYFYDGPETLGPNMDINGPEFYHEKISADDVFEYNAMEGEIGYIGVKNLQLDIPSIEICVKNQKIEHTFKNRDEVNHLLVLLISTFDDVAKLVDQSFTSK